MNPLSNQRNARARQVGFTLLEVLVAIAILGLGLTVVSSAQTGVFWSYSKATKLSQAPGLARCKMAEVELKLLRDGYPLVDEDEEGDCCEDMDVTEYRCSWKIQRVVLPELPMGNFGADAGTPEDQMGEGELGEVRADPMANMGPLGALAAMGQNAGLGEKPGMSAFADAMSGSGGSGLASMFIGFVYPDLKIMLEASIRKVIVTVHFKEGESDRELSVTQYVTNPQQGGFDPLAAQGLDAMQEGTNTSPAPASSGSGAKPGGGFGGLFGGGR
jgi:general secretion pathway protein I